MHALRPILKNRYLNLIRGIFFWISWAHRNRQLQKIYSIINNLQINKVLTKHVKYFNEIYPKIILPSALIKPSIIVISPDKHYIPVSHCIVVCVSDSGYAEYFNSYGLPTYKLEIMAHLQRHSISCTFNWHRLQGLPSNVCGRYCCIYTLHRAKR